MNKERNVGPWRVARERAAFENPWIKIVDHAVVHPDGTSGEYGVVQFKNLAIGVLPFDETGMVTLVGQHRFPHDTYSWELPEGGGALGVEPLESAKRELAEETGINAQNWAPLSAFDVSNSVTDERAVCFFAWGLSNGAAAPEPSEALTLKQVSFKALLDMVMSGEITDSLTIVMVLTALAKALRGEAPAPISAHILASVPRK
ncbi:NUDIX domain-containing protein [Hyphococcus sp.]|uniref:NUDIX domain-containing protein n=1 Tax=Hyphococcus sp. TaxID=2038636 RepID=UPI00208CE47A|nr:MAG: DNA mismatch repair protein MutT [Marinicaulis sp.]